MSDRHEPWCWLAQNGAMENGDPMPPCEGRPIRAHLISQQQLNRVKGESGDPRSYVTACGGLTGIGGHHGAFDVSKRLRVPYEALPPGTIVMAKELGILWWLERTYQK